MADCYDSKNCPGECEICSTLKNKEENQNMKSSNEDTKARILNLLQAALNFNDFIELRDYLESTDYFTAPASIKHHGNYEGALAKHSLNVEILFREKVKKYNLNVSDREIIIAGLMHDLCKTNVYHKFIDKAKTTDGYEIGYVSYTWKDNLPFGHGEKSVMLLQKTIALTNTEISLIRWHMGFTEVGFDQRTFNNAVAICPAIIAFHTADWEASTYLDHTNVAKSAIEKRTYAEWCKFAHIKDKSCNTFVQNFIKDEEAD